MTDSNNKLKMHSPNITDANIAKIRDLFPGCVAEAKDEQGNLKLAVDFDQLKQELSNNLVEGPQERYHLNWPGKREALLTANAPIAKTLRPCKKESVNFDTTENLFIEGDNLEALKLLQETYLGKVKMIYIDPPYNTGNDFIYEDDFSENSEEFLTRSNQKDEVGNRLVANTESNGRFHSDWLSFIYPRLKLARNLLSDDGVIFISIGDAEVGNLIKLCDEIFGSENFIANFIWEKRTNRENRKVVSSRHDYVLAYCKNKSTEYKALKQLPMTEKALANYKNPDDDIRGEWKSDPATAQSGHATKSQFYTLVAPNGKLHELPSGRCWAFTEEEMKKAIFENRIWFGKDGNGVPRIKTYLNSKERGLTPETIIFSEDASTNEIAKNQLKSLFDGKAVFDTPKPVSLIKQLILMSCEKGIILDFFAGSSVVADAVLQQNSQDSRDRKFIMVQLPEACDEKSEAFKAGYKTIAEISKERIRRAGNKILESVCHEDWNQDVGFRVLKVDESNMADTYYTPDDVVQGDFLNHIDNVKPGRDEPLDLLFQVLLESDAGLTSPIEQKTIQGKTVFIVNHTPYDLVACFDKGIDEALVKELAALEPMRLVFRNIGFEHDDDMNNAEQLVRQLSPHTDVKVI